MNIEKYTVGGKSYIKVGICGVLESRCKLIMGRFLNFVGDLQDGWYPVQIEGIEKPVLFSQTWVSTNSPLSEGENLTMLWDTIDNAVWLIERTDMPLSMEPEDMSTASLKQIEQSSSTDLPAGAGLKKEDGNEGTRFG